MLFEMKAVLARGLAATTAAVMLSCGGGGGDTAAPTAPPVTPPPTSSLGDYPDPFLLDDGGSYYAYATNAGNRNVQVSRSQDLHSWQPLPDAMPVLPAWAEHRFGLVWAPEVLKLGSRYLLYYTARDVASGKQCVGVAEAAQPAGPYADPRSAPLVCQVAEGGTIDASPLQAGSELYLYFKNDGNCCGMPTSLYAQRLSADGLSVQGDPVRLLTNQAAWEGAVIEAPTMWVHDGRYHLFYSAGNYADTSYAVGYALCDTPLGPCLRAGNGPILKSRPETTPPLVGPGHQGLLQQGDQTWIAYHGWEVTANGQRGNRRVMFLDKLDWVNGVPVVRGPTLVQ